MTVMTDMRIDPEQMMLEGVDTSKKPLFTVSEMAKFFFARSNHWVRWLEQTGKMTITDPDGTVREVGTRRSEKMNGRVYTLSDIEEIAHALAANSSISGAQLRHTLLLVKAQAVMNGYL